MLFLFMIFLFLKLIIISYKFRLLICFSYDALLTSSKYASTMEGYGVTSEKTKTRRFRHLLLAEWAS